MQASSFAVVSATCLVLACAMTIIAGVSNQSLFAGIARGLILAAVLMSSIPLTAFVLLLGWERCLKESTRLTR